MHLVDGSSPNREQFLGADARETAIKALLYVCAAAVVAVAYLVFHYTDYTDTLDNAVMLAECIAQGNVLDYYHYAAVNAHPDTVYSANYNIALYLVFLVWNLPTVILHLTSGKSPINSEFPRRCALCFMAQWWLIKTNAAQTQQALLERRGSGYAFRPAARC